MRKRVAAIASIALITMGSINVWADTSMKILLDGNKLSSREVQIINSRTMVPFRAIFEGLGAENVLWDQNTKTVTGIKAETTVSLSIGNNVAFVNGNAEKIEVPPQVVGQSTLVPLSFISERMGYKVAWDGKTKTVNIMSDEYYETVKDTISLAVNKGANTSPNPNSDNNLVDLEIIDNAKVVNSNITNTALKPSSNVASSGNVSPATIKGTFAMQNLKKTKFVMQFQGNGNLEISQLGTKKIENGTYNVKGKEIIIKSTSLNGTFVVELIKGDRNYYVFKPTSSGPAFAITSISYEDFTSAIK